MVSQKTEGLLIENQKLNNEIIELKEKVNILTDLLNNPENIEKYVDENGNLNFDFQEEQQYENENNEVLKYINNNTNYYNNEDIQYNIKALNQNNENENEDEKLIYDNNNIYNNNENNIYESENMNYNYNDDNPNLKNDNEIGEEGEEEIKQKFKNNENEK